ncbi:hypothetical protein [Flammeovirga sp. SJP92]|uniref:hypothetical protein n=1 Tax=Flammeovirga sp. SJP92 TaxID=1775430 RepID=UPI000789072D|nr:hypothetical protein [Flammeovirga sp. SJP92]KXX69471.1 hypothetical protein AVL50_19155 [Flammeovirga sp. SJP92]
MKQTLILYLILFYQVNLFAQEAIFSEGYYNLKIGSYETQSLNTELKNIDLPTIQPQTKFTEKENICFIKVPETGIILFQSFDFMKEPIGLLNKTSIVELDSIYYQEIFNKSENSWSLTFNVWYAVSINGAKYYTDYKIHNSIAYTEIIKEYNQKLLLISESTGYDQYYDLGYPGNFFVVILDNENNILFESNILDFNYGDEFWEPELTETVTSKMTEKGFGIKIIGLNEEFNGMWNGKELIINSKEDNN